MPAGSATQIRHFEAELGLIFYLKARQFNQLRAVGIFRL